MINRNAVSGVIPAAVADEILKDVNRGSLLMRLGTRKAVVGGKIRWAQVGDRPIAYFVGETEAGTVSRATIGATEASAKKLMVLVPFSREALEDSSIDLFEELRPEMAEAIYRKLDQTYLYGNGSVEGVKSVLEAAQEAGNVVTLGSGKDLASDLQAVIRATSPKATRLAIDDDLQFDLADLRDKNRRPLVSELTTSEGTVQRIYGREITTFPASDTAPVEYNGGQYALRALGFADRALYVGVARDMEYRILTEATLNTDEGPLYLAQQDLVALMLTFRVAAAVAADGRVSVGLEEIEEPEEPGDGGQGQE